METLYNASPTCINEEESKTYDVFDGFDETIEMVQAAPDCCVGDPKNLTRCLRMQRNHCIMVVRSLRIYLHW